MIGLAGIPQKSLFCMFVGSICHLRSLTFSFSHPYFFFLKVCFSKQKLSFFTKQIHNSPFSTFFATFLVRDQKTFWWYYIGKIVTSFDTYHCLSPLLTFDLEKGYIKGEKRTQKQQNNDTRKLLFKQCIWPTFHR